MLWGGRRKDADLKALIERLRPLLPPSEIAIAEDYREHGEPLLAAEHMIDRLSDLEISISTDLADAISKICHDYGLPDERYAFVRGLTEKRGAKPTVAPGLPDFEAEIAAVENVPDAAARLAALGAPEVLAVRALRGRFSLDLEQAVAAMRNSRRSAD